MIKMMCKILLVLYKNIALSSSIICWGEEELPESIRKELETKMIE